MPSEGCAWRAGSGPGFVDVTVFNMLRDDALLHTAPDMTACPSLKALFDAVGSVPEVKAWVDKWEASATPA